ncbi:MAG: hypothetical protein AAFR83_26700, partial [Cyanobacteria bacterium J06629_18]
MNEVHALSTSKFYIYLKTKYYYIIYFPNYLRCSDDAFHHRCGAIANFKQWICFESRKYEKKGVKYRFFLSNTMLAHAQELVYTLKELMPTQYQKDNLETMLGLFLEAQG